MSDLPDGRYERLIDGSLARRLDKALGERWRERVQVSSLEQVDATATRRAVLIEAVRAELAAVLSDVADGADLDSELAIILSALRAVRISDDTVPTTLLRPLELLTGVQRNGLSHGESPRTGLTRPWLFTAGRHDPSLLDELRREMTQVDQVDLLMSFITWSGVRKIRDLIQQATTVDAAGSTKSCFRILTTTYIGATEVKAVQWLAEQPGVELHICLDGGATRLHAKAWIFRRASGFGTVYVGSANLTGAALAGGLEWTVKATQSAQPDLFATAIAHFETLWQDQAFSRYDPKDPSHRQALQAALHRQQPGARSLDGQSQPWFSIQPKPYQQVLLDRLAAERRHGRWRNLLVAATGTGKTVIAACDYRATCQEVRGKPRLLMIAHQIQILRQARATFIQVLREPDFGELCGDGHQPERFDHCFCTIQSFRSQRLAERFPADHWHTVIIDECHHLPADGYGELLRLRPRILLGLTATPERTDGRTVEGLFDRRLDGGPAAELRLWEALDQQLLAPFEYYACEDQTDFSTVAWDRGERERSDLDRILSGNHARALTVIDALERQVSDPRRMRALAFCVSVAHARFMTERFIAHGLAAEVVVGDDAVTAPESRRTAPSRLGRGELQVLCVCDLYNEGIDIPEVDTLLLLRPTHSPVLIQQQIGRGLRQSQGKESCLILDLVGRHHQDFRSDRVLTLLSGLTRGALTGAVAHGFSALPPGCHIQLDRVPREQVLHHLRSLTVASWRHLVREAQAWCALGASRRSADLATFLRETGIDLVDLYRSGSGDRSWSALRRACGWEDRPLGVAESAAASNVMNLLEQDDPELLAAVRRIGEGAVAYAVEPLPRQRQRDAIAAELFPGRADVCTGAGIAQRLADAPALRDELVQLAEILADRIDRAPILVPGLPADWPFHLHASYSLRSLMLLSGKMAAESRSLPQAGLILFPEQRIEFLLVTLDKSSGFSARSSFHDYAISPECFHWQSQNSASPESTAGRRYIYGKRDGWTAHLLVRRTKLDLYRMLGQVSYESHEGQEPMSIIWRMAVPIPLALYRSFSVLREGA